MGREVRVLLSAYESRGDAELLAGLDPHRRGDVAATLLVDAASRERPPVSA